MKIEESLSVEERKLSEYLQEYLFSRNPNRIKPGTKLLKYLGGLETRPNIWKEIISSIQNILDGKQIDNPGWKKIQNNNYEYHVRGQYKVVYSWEMENKQKVLLLKAIGHSSKVMPVMNKL